MKFKYRDNRQSQNPNRRLEDSGWYFPQYEATASEEREKKREWEIPTIKVQRRIELEKESKMFYLSLVILNLIAMVWSLITDRFGVWVSSLFSIAFIVWIGYFTNPGEWKKEKYGLSLWNASVTMGVLIKSIAPNVYKYRKALMWMVFVGFAFALPFKVEIAALFFSVFLTMGFVALAEKDFAFYAWQARTLAWFGLLPTIFLLITKGGIPLAYTVLQAVLFNLYERLDDLTIEYPYWLDHEGDVS